MSLSRVVWLESVAMNHSRPTDHILIHMPEYRLKRSEAFVPPKPKLETPALRGELPWISQLLDLVFTINGLVSHGILGFGVLKLIDGGNNL